MEKNRLYIRLILIVTFILLIFHSFTGEIVAYNNGAGWDGETYLNIVQNFSDLINSHGIDSYHMTRFLPFAILHFILSFLFDEITLNIAIVGMKILNVTCLGFLLFFFFRILNFLKLKVSTEILAFSFCFFNYPVLKLFGYYPMLCDCSALLLSYMGIYYYLTNKQFGIYITAILATMTWPILSVVLCILAVFPKLPVYDNINDPLSKKINIFIHIAITLFIPLCAGVFYILKKYKHPEYNISEIFSANIDIKTAPILIIAALFTSMFFFIAYKPFYINWNRLLADLISKKFIFKFFLTIITFSLFIKYLNSLGGEAVFSPIGQIIVMVQYPISKILFFLETHFFYLGVFFLLILFYWRNIINNVKTNFGIGYFIVCMIGLLFITEIETRKLEAFYPIFLVPLIQIINEKNIKKWCLYILPIFCIFFSLFWFQINVSGIEEAFIKPYNTYNEFPAQRYFMMFGPWQSNIVYLIVISIEIFMGLIIYFGNKNNLFFYKK